MRTPGLARRLAPVFVAILLTLAVGTVGYMWLEGWTGIDALYMTAITLTTVGFGEVRPLSNAGRLFTIGLIVLGVGVVAYGSSVVGEYILTGDLGAALRRRRMTRNLSHLRDHFLICGLGRVGESAARMLEESERTFVVVDNSPEAVALAAEQGWLAVHGDATRDEVLLQVGLERASGMLVCTHSDADNLFIVLSARALKPELYIVARSTESGNEAKMVRAGANKVVSPYQIGGRHMANCLIRPNVIELLDAVTLNSGLELWLEELRLEPGTPLAGQTVVEADIRQRTGVTLLAIRRPGSGATVTPDGGTRLREGDELIVIGTREQLRSLEMVAHS